MTCRQLLKRLCLIVRKGVTEVKERGTDGGHILLLPVTCAWTRFGICRERILHAKCQDSSTGQIGSQFFFFFFFFFFLGGGGGVLFFFFSLFFFSLSFFFQLGG